MNIVDLLEEMSIRAEKIGDRAALAEMMRTYPEHAADLQDAFVEMAVLEFAPERELTAAERSRYTQHSQELLRSLLSGPAPAAESIASLNNLAKEQGLSKAELAEKLGVSISLLMYLEKRRVQFSTIPKVLIGRIAAVLKVAEEAVATYLNAPPSFAGASYKATERPEEQQAKAFAEVVSEDQMLTDEQRSQLLALTDGEK